MNSDNRNQIFVIDGNVGLSQPVNGSGNAAAARRRVKVSLTIKVQRALRDIQKCLP